MLLLANKKSVKDRICFNIHFHIQAYLNSTRRSMKTHTHTKKDVDLHWDTIYLSGFEPTKNTHFSRASPIIPTNH